MAVELVNGKFSQGTTSTIGSNLIIVRARFASVYGSPTKKETQLHES